MNCYEELLDEAHESGLIVKEKPLLYNDGRIKGNRIAIRKSINTSIEKSCVLAEELGHHHTTVGNILDQTDINNVKQERKARLWAYDRQIGLIGLIRAYEAKCHSRYEVAEFLDVPEDFLQSAIDCYRSKYGTYKEIDDYIIFFEPSLAVMRKF